MPGNAHLGFSESSGLSSCLLADFPLSDPWLFLLAEVLAALLGLRLIFEAWLPSWGRICQQKQRSELKQKFDLYQKFLLTN